MSRTLYSILFALLLPVIIARLFWRARREPLYGRHIGERLGLYAARPVGNGPLVWLHAVSLGEVRAAQPLIEALRRARPDVRLLLTHMTATGREAGVALLRPGDAQAWLPYDLPQPCRRFLAHFGPDVGVLIETEVWPNLAHACVWRQVPLLLANARMSARSAARWARWSGLAAPAFGALSGAAAQTDADAQRLRRLGVRNVRVAGNVKFDRAADPALQALGRQWRAAAGIRPVLLLASTREQGGVSEEALLLDAMPAPLLQRILLVVVPRHPQRMASVEALLRDRGLRVQRRGIGLPDATTQVWLGDSLGEMPAYYAMADAAFIGGSLLPLGGQNLIEACAEGCPVVIGPHSFNFTQAVALGVEAGAVVPAADAAAVWARLQSWLDEPQARAAAHDAALQFCADHRGAADIQAAWVVDALAG